MCDYPRWMHKLFALLTANYPFFSAGMTEESVVGDMMRTIWYNALCKFEEIDIFTAHDEVFRNFRGNKIPSAYDYADVVKNQVEIKKYYVERHKALQLESDNQKAHEHEVAKRELAKLKNMLRYSNRSNVPKFRQKVIDCAQRIENLGGNINEAFE